MSQFATRLVANYTTNKIENGDEYPIHFHRLSFTVILSMFQTLIRPLVEENHQVLGAQTTVNENDIILLDAIINSVAYECVVAIYAVLYNKASRISGQTVHLFGNIPRILTAEFPSYCTALINSIGPVQFADVPSRGSHLPYLVWTDVHNGRPDNFALYQAVKFKEQTARSKTISLASVDVMVTASSPWWTFHAYPAPEHTTDHPKTSLWSPVRSDECEQALKLGVLFAKEKLTIGVGVINYSATPYYPLDNPARRNFPAESQEYPFFVRNQPAFHELVEAHTEPEHVQRTTPQNTPVAGSSGSVRGEKRKLPDGTASETNEAVAFYRRVYHYFDHIVVVSANQFEILAWARELNSTS